MIIFLSIAKFWPGNIWPLVAARTRACVACPQNQQVKFGAINPHQRASLLVSMAFTGKEKIAVHGVERELDHFVLKSEAGDWSMWLDDQFKLVRILVASDNTEVVRD